MSQKVKIELNHRGIQELLCSGDVKKMIDDHANAIVGRAGDEFEAEVKIIDNSLRYGAYIRPATAHAYYSNLKHNTLLKAVRG